MPLNSDCDLVESCAPPLSPHCMWVTVLSIHGEKSNCSVIHLASLHQGARTGQAMRPISRKYNAVMLRAKLEIAVNDREFSLEVGDITKIPADAIGNAANSQLVGGGGVDGAIHRAGGPAIMRELDQIRERSGRCPAGDAVATAAGNLPARWVFHAVGPVYSDGQHGEATALRSCYQRCLALADEVGARTLTLPAISTGVYGYPMDQAAEIAVSTVAGMLSAAETRVQRATFVLFDELAFREFATAALDIALPLRP